jgi:hypothetical protein
MDTSVVSELLKYGNVIFSESITKLDSCNQYVIKGKILEKNLKIRVENCDKTATITEAEVK